MNDLTIKMQNKRRLELYDQSLLHAERIKEAVDSGDLNEEFGARILQGEKPMAAVAATQQQISVGEQAEYAGTSQLSAAGRACIPCGNDHFSTVSGLLAEAMRFARDHGVSDPEVILRISQAEDELNAFERVDAAPDKVVDLPAAEKEMMAEMLRASRGFRHGLSDIKNTEDLELLAADVKRMRDDFRIRVFGMQLAHS
ncbi:MAG: hypothetical protein WC455_13100 [Dehalococcoidia bacterium]